MGYADDFDEEGEPIMDPDMDSDAEAATAAVDPEEDWDAEPNSPSIEAAFEEEARPKPRKRLVKKSTEDDSRTRNDIEEVSADESPQKIRHSKEKDRRASKGEGKPRKPKSAKGEKSLHRGIKRGEKEINEMWDSVVGGDSEDDQEGLRTKEDDAFIDDTGVGPNDRFAGSDDEAASIGDAPQAEEGEEDDELNKFFKAGKKRNKKFERTAEETAMLVEQFMARLEVAAEEDAELNRQSKPAINKLRMLPVLTNVLFKRQLQQEFLDRGVLSVLKNWLEPLPDGSLPNITIRNALLKILTDLPIDVELYERREQLKKSGLGKVIMFLSRSDEETPGNRRLARDLVDKWSRPIFQKSTRYEDLRNYDDERAPLQRTPVKKPVAKPTDRFDSQGDDLDLVDVSQEPKPGQPGYRLHASRPEAIPLDFVVRPAHKIDAEDIRARAKQQRHDERRMKMNKKLQQLRTPKRKKLQAEKISVEGRGLVKFF